jgi:hypothetical protein
MLAPSGTWQGNSSYEHVVGISDVSVARWSSTLGEEAIDAVKTAAVGIRTRRFEATPSWGACRACAYNQICPFTATSD